MKEILPEILLFAGTTEGRRLSEYLAENEIRHTICVATAYGEIVLKQHPLVTVHRGRMEQEQIETFLQNGQFKVVVDATHPFAEHITRNIQAALEKMRKAGASVSYLRLKREGMAAGESGIACFETHEACARALAGTEGRILLTTGSRALSRYCASEEIRKRLYVRVLPSEESIAACKEQGLCGKQIIAMQGPFTAEMNEALIRQYGISCLVTKESGAAGGYPQKLEAAKKTGTQVFVIGCPKEDDGYSFAGICGELQAICGKKLRAAGRMEITLAGIGMGHADCLTKEVGRAVNEADILLGAERMWEHMHVKAEKHPFYQAKQVIPYLQSIQGSQNTKIVVLFSGDSGFYSGCHPLYTALQEEIREGRLQASLRILPGISSVAYLASCIGETYQEAEVCSLHGKEVCNLARKIRNSPKTFLLTSGVKDVNRLGRLLCESGMPECEVITGYRLSYEEQRIERHTPAECCGLKEEGLYTCFVRNPYAVGRKLTHGIADAEFIRDRVPMTKEEVREVSICKLRLREGAVLYDIGSGTGSVAVEAAALSDSIQVYAVEQKKEAVSLIEKNRQQFGLENITVTEAEAPEGLWGLPAATHAFIGGSGGRLAEILAALRQINPGMRVVINAVSMETVCEIREILAKDVMIKEEEVVQLQVSRAEKAGSHHLMKAENPVWICAFTFCGM